MAFKLGEGFIEFDLDDGKLNSKLNKTFAAVDRFNKKMGASFTRLAKITTGVVAAGFALSIKLATQQAKAEAKLASVLETTNHAAGFRLDELKAFASEMQETLAVADDLIIDTMGILGSFVEITGENFKWATEMVFNLAELMGTDAKSAAVQLGKALNDPIKGLTSLSRSGVSFSGSTKQIIKDMVEMGDIAGAQTIILQEMADQGLGGLAKAAGDTQGIVKLKNTLGDVMEEFGTPFLKPIEELSAALRDLLKDDSFKKLGTDIASIVTEIIKLKGEADGASDDLGSRFIAKQHTREGRSDSELLAHILRLATGGQVKATGRGAVDRSEVIRDIAKEFAQRAFDEGVAAETAARAASKLEKFNIALAAAEAEMRKLANAAEEKAKIDAKTVADAKALGGARERMDALVEDILGGGGRDPRTQSEIDLAAQIKALQDATQSPQNLFQSLDAVSDMFSTTTENEQQKQLDVLKKQLKEEEEQRKLQQRIAEAVENPPPPRLGE